MIMLTKSFTGSKHTVESTKIGWQKKPAGAVFTGESKPKFAYNNFASAQHTGKGASGGVNSLEYSHRVTRVLALSAFWYFAQ
jgi:hypothetical protein